MEAKFDHHPVAALLARVDVEITEEEILADLAFPADRPFGGWGRDEPPTRLDHVNGHGGRSRTHPRRRAAPAAR